MSEDLTLTLVAFLGVIVGALAPDLARELYAQWRERREARRWRRR